MMIIQEVQFEGLKQIGCIVVDIMQCMVKVLELGMIIVELDRIG